MIHDYPPFKQIPHTADLELQAFGLTIEELFANALKGMFSVIEPHFVPDAADIKRSVAVNGADLETLLINFLAECLYLSDIHNEAYTDAQIKIHDKNSNKELQATVTGKAIEKFEVVEIKAVTYHNLCVKQIDGIWQATIVFDI